MASAALLSCSFSKQFRYFIAIAAIVAVSKLLIVHCECGTSAAPKHAQEQHLCITRAVLLVAASPDNSDTSLRVRYFLQFRNNLYFITNHGIFCGPRICPRGTRNCQLFRQHLVAETTIPANRPAVPLILYIERHVCIIGTPRAASVRGVTSHFFFKKSNKLKFYLGSFNNPNHNEMTEILHPFQFKIPKLNLNSLQNGWIDTQHNEVMRLLGNHPLTSSTNIWVPETNQNFPKRSSLDDVMRLARHKPLTGSSPFRLFATPQNSTKWP
jgi:hypothetical protein